MSDAADGWRWYDPTGENVHLVRDGDETTICGLSVDSEMIGDAKAHLGVPVPYHRAACDRCRASFARQQLDEADIDTEAIEEGDGLVFWDGADPTDSSEHPLRRAGTIEEVPPYKMFEGTRKDTVTIEDSVKVRLDSMTLTTVPLEGRIYAVVPDPDDPEEFRSGGLGGAIAGAVSEAMTR